jgi:hypothetical protein
VKRKLTSENYDEKRVDKREGENNISFILQNNPKKMTYQLLLKRHTQFTGNSHNTRNPHGGSST